MTRINGFIQHPQLQIEQREKINRILFTHYKKYAINKAYEFKKRHHYKCKNIDIHDLILSSQVGLFKAIQKYNGKHSFIHYSEFYIKGELLKILSRQFASSGITVSLRMKNKNKLTAAELAEYKEQMRLFYQKSFCSLYTLKADDFYDKAENSSDNEMLSAIIEREKLAEKWAEIGKRDSFSKRVAYLAYDFELNKVRTNKQVSELMMCSQETIRKKLQRIEF